MLFENTAEIIGVFKANGLCRFGNTAASALYEKTEDFYAKVHFLFYIKKMTCQEHSRSSWRKIRFFQGRDQKSRCVLSRSIAPLPRKAKRVIILENKKERQILFAAIQVLDRLDYGKTATYMALPQKPRQCLFF